MNWCLMMGSEGNSSSFLSLEINAPDLLGIGEDPRNELTPEETGSICDSSVCCWVTGLSLESKGSCWEVPWRCLFNLLPWNHRALQLCAHREVRHLLRWLFGAAAGQPEAAPGNLESWSHSSKCLCTLHLLVRQQTLQIIRIKLLFLSP